MRFECLAISPAEGAGPCREKNSSTHGFTTALKQPVPFNWQPFISIGYLMHHSGPKVVPVAFFGIPVQRNAACIIANCSAGALGCHSEITCVAAVQ